MYLSYSSSVRCWQLAFACSAENHWVWRDYTHPTKTTTTKKMHKQAEAQTPNRQSNNDDGRNSCQHDEYTISTVFQLSLNTKIRRWKVFSFSFVIYRLLAFVRNWFLTRFDFDIGFTHYTYSFYFCLRRTKTLTTAKRMPY